MPAIVLILLICAGARYWYHQTRYPSTQNAYVHTATIQIAAEVNGPITAIYVKNHAYVKKGQLLLLMDLAPFQIALEHARAQLDLIKQEISAANIAIGTAQARVEQRKAELQQAESVAKRSRLLIKNQYVSDAQNEQSIKYLHVATATLSAAKSELAQAIKKRGLPGDNNANLRIARTNIATALLNLKHTKIIAPSDGYLSHFTLRPGQMVTAYQPLFALIKNRSWWVNANFKETQLNRIHPKQPATITLDMYPNQHFKGQVESISHASESSFALLPAENASGNWVKVTQRFIVKIKILDNKQTYPLRLGASSEVIIDTTS